MAPAGWNLAAFMRSLPNLWTWSFPEAPGFAHPTHPIVDNIHDLAYFYLDILDQLDSSWSISSVSRFGGWIRLSSPSEHAGFPHSRWSTLPASMCLASADRYFLRTDEQRNSAFFHDQALADEMVARLLKPELETSR